MAKWLTRWSAKPVFAGSIPARCSKLIISLGKEKKHLPELAAIAISWFSTLPTAIHRLDPCRGNLSGVPSEPVPLVPLPDLLHPAPGGVLQVWRGLPQFSTAVFPKWERLRTYLHLKY